MPRSPIPLLLAPLRLRGPSSITLLGRPTATADARANKKRGGRTSCNFVRRVHSMHRWDRRETTKQKDNARARGGREGAGRARAGRSLICRRLLSPKLISYLDRWLPCTTPTKNWDFFAASPIPPLSEMYVLFFRKFGVFFYPLPSLCVDVIYGIPLPC